MNLFFFVGIDQMLELEKLISFLRWRREAGLQDTDPTEFELIAWNAKQCPKAYRGHKLGTKADY